MRDPAAVPRPVFSKPVYYAVLKEGVQVPYLMLDIDTNLELAKTAITYSLLQGNDAGKTYINCKTMFKSYIMVITIVILSDIL